MTLENWEMEYWTTLGNWNAGILDNTGYTTALDNTELGNWNNETLEYWNIAEHWITWENWKTRQHWQPEYWNIGQH
ncbi:hypothetical protein Glove_29g7 [Diversispora epigaea]|uniref:Uncharacterized protein n=1 Tax=Diversispora epigaea TaxID=1348612 RepID=A0A397JPD9_9GLOM|nr:hypothetical protein Glove_29g7 [Diversispora epigaea]